ncbi:MAG: hypothetical protein IJ127_21535, partial [Afipia sp.]|nr:hypothetical protein [Afipia sp.]
MDGTDNLEGVDEEVTMTLLHPGRGQRPKAIGFAGCSGTQRGRITIQTCHEKMHLFCARFVV